MKMVIEKLSVILLAMGGKSFGWDWVITFWKPSGQGCDMISSFETSVFHSSPL
jgi:hypothetical protein